MAKASLNNIYDRLNSVSSYHPFTADTFADWSMEAGDIVSISRNGETVTAPISSTTVRWNGSQQVSIESRGEKERESVAKMSAKAFNSGGNGGTGFRSGCRGRSKTNSDLIVLDDQIMAYVKSEDGKLQSSINIQADRIDIVVDGDGHVKPAAITAAITDKDGYLTSSIKISADKVMIDGNTSINNVFSVDGQAVRVKRRLYVSSGTGLTSIYGGTIITDTYYCGTNKMNVANVSVSGNDLTITYIDGTTKDFNKATTLEGAWNGSRKFTVNAYQTNGGRKEKVNEFSTTVVGSIAKADFDSWDGYWGTAKLKATVGASESPVNIGSILVNAQQAYDNGKASVPSYSNSAVLTFVRFDDDYEEYLYRSETLITRNSTGATKTVHYN